MAARVRWLSLAGSLVFSFPALAETVTLQQGSGYFGASDARITCCDTANTNDGSAPLHDVIVDSSTSVLIRFAVFQREGGLVPDNATIQSATLSLYKNWGPSAVLKLNRVLKPWTESGVTWNVTGAGASWTVAGAFGGDDVGGMDSETTAGDSSACPADPPAPPSCWVQFDVTGALQEFGGGAANNGWKLSYVNDGDGSQTNSHGPKELYSNDNTRAPSLRPTLTVTYTVPTGGGGAGGVGGTSGSVSLQDGASYTGTSDARITCCDTANANEGGNAFYALIGENSTVTLIRYKIFLRDGGQVPDNASITSATLKLYKYWGPASTFKVNRVLKDWSEPAVTWNTTGAGAAWSAPGASSGGDINSIPDAQAITPDSQSVPCPANGPGPDACWMKLDVTAAVQAFSDGTSPNYGWRLAYVNDGNGSTTNMNQPKEMYSADATRDPTLRPILEVSWTTGGPKRANSVTLYRSYRASNTDWLYTSSATERDTPGFVDYGIAGFCDDTADSGGVPLYRFWKGPPQNEHFYTTREADKTAVLTPEYGYQYEGIVCYLQPSQTASTAGFRRMTKFNASNGDLVHFYTTDANEIAQKLAEGFTDERDDGYIRPPGAANPDPSKCANPDGGYEGFGRNSTGGAGKAVYHVTRLDDPDVYPPPDGTLRAALELNGGNRCIVFDQGGTIQLHDRLTVYGENVTIDGFSAPSFGITLLGPPLSSVGATLKDQINNTKPGTLVIEGMNSRGNVVVRGIRHRQSISDDGMRVFGRTRGSTDPAVTNVVFDHVSVTGQGDGAIDVTEGATNVTIQWSILGKGSYDDELNLIQFGAYNISLHHNLYVNAKARMPACYDLDATDPGFHAAGSPQCDVRNNLIWNSSQAGTEVRFRATANVVNNYYAPGTTTSQNQMIWLYDDGGGKTGSAYISGNHSTNPAQHNVEIVDRTTPFFVDPFFIPVTDDAFSAARRIKADAGAHGPHFDLDQTDQGFVNSVTIP